jgi:hypothetical protein
LTPRSGRSARVEAVALFASRCREAGDAEFVDVAQPLEGALLPAP